MKKSLLPLIVASIFFMAGCKKNTDTAVPPSVISLPSVKIGNQTWTSTNLNVTAFRNGDLIPKVTDQTVWANLTTPAWCWSNNDSATYSSYGKLYNWYAVNDARGLAPAGWHIPSDVECTTLSTTLGGDGVAGGAMKESGTVHWLSPNAGASNSSGFTGLPGGNRDENGNFNNMGKYGSFWNSTEFDGAYVGIRALFFEDGSFAKYQRYKAYGYSVRCVKD